MLFSWDPLFVHGALFRADCPASLESVPSLFSAHTRVKYVKSSSGKKCPQCYQKKKLSAASFGSFTGIKEIGIISTAAAFPRGQ